MKSSSKLRITASCLFGAIIILLLNFEARSQHFPDQFGIGVLGSSVKMIGGEFDRSTIEQWAGIQGYYVYSPSLSFNFNLAYGWVYPKALDGSQFKPVGNFKTILLPFDISLNYHFTPPGKLRPYVAFGTGLTLWDIRQLDENFSLFSPGNSVKSRLSATLIGGVGIEYIVMQDRVINLLINYHRLLKGNEDTIGFGDDGNNGIAEVRLGFSYFFGGFRDRDKDGIEDRLDRDPDHPEDFDGFKDTDGAPDPDNDNDGIPDVKDKAPNNAEDFDGFKDADGIPDPDNDGDGIKDSDDKCPNKPEDFDNFEDLDGCPDFDNDKDGIPDSLDKCPNLREDRNGYLDKDGCPDEESKPKPNREPYQVGQRIILKGVNFASGSARLSTRSFPILDEVVRALVEFPNIELKILGYTDNTGNFDSNRRLSARRAYAVRKYFIDHGIHLRRLRAVGNGEMDPVASNFTREGRAANRRIELIRIK